MDINTLILTFLVIFMLHNLEEVIMVERWVKKNYPRVKDKIPLFIQKEIDNFINVTAAQFALVVFIISVFSSILILVAVIGDYMFLFLGLAMVFALNIFTHPIQSLLLRTYTPGVLTSIFLVIPYYIILINYFYTEDFINMKMIWGALVVVAIFVPVFILSHTIGEKVAKKL
ncbi:HXXEE domain-containing protein [Virgibacillus proomii]|uniref:HXXEE domain-containing protein n=1 Tax=Virgibacillus proomii TaxID=84407 RepID=UPI001C11B7BB|nr:HXXEE domain-containing protein [Virgibacillus proomii]MBU5267521.1 HXXEE domain-containing protein [Virgibacillus proomii]